jgi:uncharacterized membrane protein YcaP (DUF421 family)
MDRMEPFDLQRIFLGKEPPWFLLEVVFRTAWMYVYALIVIRYIGKRGLREMSSFEYVLIVALGSAAGDPMFYPEIPLLHGMVVIATVVIIQRIVVRVMQRSKRAKDFFYHGDSRLLVMDGQVCKQTKDEEGFSDEEIEMVLRESGIKNMGEIWRAYLEPSGEISVFKFPEEEKRSGRSILPPDPA